jgi:HprK-related kinase A
VAAGVSLQTGPFTVRLNSRLSSVVDGIARMYCDFPIQFDAEFADFHVQVERKIGVRGWLRPQACFEFDGLEVFRPLPLEQAFPMFEWGLNWCVANFAHRYLMLHAAVLERGGRGLVLPGNPGAGKSTLAAALMMRGWRLLSDEIALIGLADGRLHGLGRPVSLKNASIPLIQGFDPAVEINTPSNDTAKGTVAHLRPTGDSVMRVAEPANPRWTVFPRFVAGASLQSTPMGRAACFMRVAEISFNYSLLQAQGFHVLGGFIDRCSAFELSYSKLDEAISYFDDLSSR